jgi:glutathione S-transferase
VTDAPAALLSAIITILALLVFFYMGMRVGTMRGKHNILAPATSGHPEFDRAFRVHYNTLESLIVFLPLLWIATIFFRPWGWLPAALGLLYVIGRVVYMQLYMGDPAKRGPGTMLSAVAELGLLILSIVGIVQAWGAETAG